ncbi:MAG: hypothetical protein IRY91_08435 [Gemmatimonadaceae bacterium]|nr:hypothetical protein [Gemmatimonadaceae bacterium]
MAAIQRTGDEKRSPAQPFAVGCLLAIPGFFGGGMIAVGIGKIVDGLTRCQPAEGWPVCNTPAYLLVGAVAGAILLPSVVVWLMLRRKGARTTGNSDRS